MKWDIHPFEATEKLRGLSRSLSSETDVARNTAAKLQALTSRWHSTAFLGDQEVHTEPTNVLVSRAFANIASVASAIKSAPPLSAARARQRANSMAEQGARRDSED